MRNIFLLLTSILLIQQNLQSQISATIDCNVAEGEMKYLNGYLGGKNDTAVYLWINPIADSLLLPTNPKFWRTGKTDNLPYADSRSISSMLIISDLFAIYKGVYPDITLAKPWLDWNDYEWFLQTLATNLLAVNLAPEYFDVWNEPEYNWSGTGEQFIECLERTITTLKHVDTTLKITGPGYSNFYGGDAILYIVDTLDYLGVHFDAVNWHEFFFPKNLTANVSKMRDSLNVRPFALNTKIQITEYGFQDNFMIPGFLVGFSKSFEYSDIDWVDRACWSVSDGINTWNTCNCGWNGMFWHDGVSPLPLYWTLRAYAELPNQKLAVSINDDTTFSVLATMDTINHEIRILAGRHDSYSWSAPAPPLNLSLTVDNYPYMSNGSIPIIILKIPAQNIYAPLAQPLLYSNSTGIVTNGSLNISIPNYLDGDVYYIYLDPSTPILSVDDGNKTAKRDLSIYPNPTLGTIHINLPYPHENFSIEIYSISGHQVFLTTNNTDVDISKFETGIYILNVKQKNNVWSTKIVKK